MDLAWHDAELPPQPSRAQRAEQLRREKYDRTLAKEQAKRDAAKDDAPAEPLLRLAEALEASRALIVLPDRKQDRSERAHLAAMQYESFQRVQTDLTALMLRGQLDPAAHREACNSIEQVTKRLFLLAERMDSGSWGGKVAVTGGDGGPLKVLLAPSDELMAAYRAKLQQSGYEAVAAVVEGEVVRRHVAALTDEQTEPE
jgi:hypothetical protein